MMNPAPTPRRLATLQCAVVLAGVLLAAMPAVPAFAASPPTALAQEPAEPAGDPLDDALLAMYNLDFEAAHRVIDAYLDASPRDAAGHATRAAAHLFAEFDRLRILELDFFGDDDLLTDRARLVPDSDVREKIHASTTEARRLADATLVETPADRQALFALGMAIGVESQYATLVEKRYIRGGSLSKESQTVADRMLALDPPIYDAYVTLGSIEYVVANLNFAFRFLARVRGLRGSKSLAVEHLRIVTEQGRYYKPFAKVLLAVFYTREGQLPEARALLADLRRSFPGNPLFAREIARIDLKLANGGR